jgi:hypothetical protein
MITTAQRHMLEVADRLRDTEVMMAIVNAILETGIVTPIEIETALRDAAARSYLIVADDDLKVVLGMKTMLTALAAAGMTPAQNRAALAGI